MKKNRDKVGNHFAVDRLSSFSSLSPDSDRTCSRITFNRDDTLAVSGAC